MIPPAPPLEVIPPPAPAPAPPPRSPGAFVFVLSIAAKLLDDPPPLAFELSCDETNKEEHVMTPTSSNKIDVIQRRENGNEEEAVIVDRSFSDFMNDGLKAC